MSRRLLALTFVLVTLVALPLSAARNGCQWCRVWTDPDFGYQDSECVSWDPEDVQGPSSKLASCEPIDICYYGGTWYCTATCDGFQCYDV